jgi:arylsulfatase A-like enzyme
MNSKNLLKVTAATTLLSTPVDQTLAESEHPNILFIAIDDMKPLLGCYGDTYAITPNIDNIASKGTTFLNNQCQWPVCGPTRASIMTGLRPELSGVMNLKTLMRDINPDIVTLPQYFKNNGYETVARGKIYDPRCVKGGRKTDDPKSWTIPYFCPNGIKIKGKPVTLAPDVSENELQDGKICNEGIKLIKSLSKKKKPFFIAVGFKKPHLPFIAPKKYWDMYDEKDIKLAPFQEMPKNADPSHNYHNSGELRGYDGVPKKGTIPPKLQKKLIHGYYACATYIDTLIGKLLSELKTAGVEDNTIICLWGDHGWHLGDHGIWGKHTTLEQAARAPLIIATPFLKGNTKTESPTEFIDIYPTLCELSGLPIPEHLNGKSLVPIMKKPEVMVKSGAITNFRRKGFGYAFRTKRYRYIEWFNMKTGKIIAKELYDYQKDPLETIDLSKNPEYKKVIEKLSKNLRAVGKNGCRLLFRKK